MFLVFYHHKASKNEMFEQCGVSTNEICQEGFLKAPVLNHSTKGATAAAFLEHPVHSILSALSEQK